MTTCACADIMAAILAELAEIREMLRPKRCTDADRATLALLLPAWAARFGGDPVLARELLADPAIAETIGRPSPGSLGGLLSRAAADRVVSAGLVVERLTTEQRARLWGLRRVSPETPAGR